MSDQPANAAPDSPGGMLCPRCRVDLLMTERQGVEIDYCPKCRGVWLDRGELDKIVERSERFAGGASAAPAQPQGQPTPSPWSTPNAPGAGQGAAAPSAGYGHGHGQGYGHGHGGGHGGVGRHSFLGRLFG
jgi:hypothetical protein